MRRIIAIRPGASLTQDKDGASLCHDKNALLPQISFSDGDDKIAVTKKAGVHQKSPAKQQRIINCRRTKTNPFPINYANELERERVERIEAAAELTETSAINKDCKRDGCPGVAIFGKTGQNGEPARIYHASYGRSQFVAATFIETLDGLPEEDKIAIGMTGDIQRRITLARGRTVRINARNGFFSLARSFECVDAPAAWDNAGTENSLERSQRSNFESQTLLDRQNFIDMACFVPDGNGRPIGEAKNAFMTESIFADLALKNWLMNLYKSVDHFNLVSRTFIKNNLRRILESEEIKARFENTEKQPAVTEQEAQAFKNRQREIELELAMRVARQHNGGAGALSSDPDVLTRNCSAKGSGPCDYGNYVKTFIGLDSGRGDWKSLRCAEINSAPGIELNPLTL